MPGLRAGAVSWTDAAGNFWLFSGTGLDAFSSDAELNELWKYNLGSNEWTWMKGGNTVNAFAVYGTQGTSAPGNTPGSSYLVFGRKLHFRRCVKKNNRSFTPVNLTIIFFNTPRN